MPFYFRRQPYSYWRRRRYRRNRPRRYIRRRYRRNYWVRTKIPKKLKRITLKQWQPATIRNCKVKGTTCLAYVNCNRMPHNSTMYEESITPDHWPGGGCFSVCQFTLKTLYSLHEKCRNWWTNSNIDLPLCRYLGCKFRFYQCEYTDYIVKVNINLPSPSNKLTYPSLQPYMMLMSSHKFIIPSKQNKKRHKPYYTKKFSPPQQLQTKWYFQVDLYNHPLIQIYTSATNLNHPFVKPQENSQCITFLSLNTTLIQNRNMSTQDNESWPYKKLGTRYHYMYYYTGTKNLNDPDKFELSHLIPLTEIKINRPGKSYYDINTSWSKETYKQYFTNYRNYWGNIFNTEHEHLEYFFISYKSPENIKQTVLSKVDSLTSDSLTWEGLSYGNDHKLTQLNESIFIPFQYNPNKDTGQDTKVYLLPNYSGDGWDPPSDNDIILEGFPLWLILWGYTDFQTKLKKVTNIPTQQIVVIRTHFTQRPTDMLIVPISKSFTEGKSPYEQQCLPSDLNMWYPMEQYQEECINKIVSCGPATPYLNDAISENINAFYTFYFKWGGCPPKQINIDDPAHQAQYPIPRNECETNSLQSPAQAIESMLYSFDYRHGNLTKTAIDRISKDWSTKDFITSIAEPSRRQQLQETLQKLEKTQEEDQQKETQILQHLEQLKLQQQLLRKRIIAIMQEATQ
nr:MAG: ORF1 [TTV-like mini virus]